MAGSINGGNSGASRQPPRPDGSDRSWGDSVPSNPNKASDIGSLTRPWCHACSGTLGGA
jgi:hypothetical protein